VKLGLKGDGNVCWLAKGPGEKGDVKGLKVEVFLFFFGVKKPVGDL
jgi:hypothetical protein